MISCKYKQVANKMKERIVKKWNNNTVISFSFMTRMKKHTRNDSKWCRKWKVTEINKHTYSLLRENSSDNLCHKHLFTVQLSSKISDWRILLLSNYHQIWWEGEYFDVKVLKT